MSRPTTIDFAGQSRVHLALAVSNLDRARAFYETLLGVTASKVRPRYVRIESEDPPLNLALNETVAVRPHVDPQHFGIQVKDLERVRQAQERMERAGHPARVEDQVACCYAVQDKVWIEDPDGHRWEVYRVTDDAADLYSPAEAEAGPCCDPTCCR